MLRRRTGVHASDAWTGIKGRGAARLTLLVSVMTLGTGRTTVLQGAVHLVILAAFLYLAIVP